MLQHSRLSVSQGVVVINLLLGCLALSLFATPITRAAPEAAITVQSAADDGTANAANCPGVNCRLRDAIASAASDDTLDFAGDYTINLVGSELAISRNLTIDGTGHSIVINGPGASCTTCFRVFSITGGSTVALNWLSINNGHSSGNFGGGVLNAGTLTVTNCTFSGNTAAWGGGLETTGTLYVTNSTFTANMATGGGAGLEVFGGTARITNSTFANNVADNGSGTGSGGGLQLDGGTLDLANVTIANNQANGASDDGGGGLMIYGGTVTILNSTIAGNTTTSPTGAAGVSIYQYVATASVTLKNTIVQSTAGKDCTITNGGTLTADSYNLANDSTCGGATQATSTQIHLGTLASNGGPAQTMALGTDSVAIDAGDGTPCAAAPVNNLDQRGQPRNDLHCDTGAFELVYGDSHTVQRPVSAAGITTFGPALAGVQRDASFVDPGITTITKEDWRAQGAESISTTWLITPTTASGFSLTLQLCYTPTELGSLKENSLRFYRYNGLTWVQVGGAPLLTTIGSNHCAQLPAITGLSRWTLATSMPTVVSLNNFTATNQATPDTLYVVAAALAVLLILSARLTHRHVAD